MSKKALIVGIDYYAHIRLLHGCVNDAYNMKSVLARHGDGTVNFDVRLIAVTGPGAELSRAELREAVSALFNDDCEISVFYFAGHGYVDSIDGYICASDTANGHDGLSLSDIVRMANESRAKNRLIVLDSCHSGGAGVSRSGSQCTELREGTTIMTASTVGQYASEENGAGVFTTLFVDALSGGAANLVGEITPGSVYAHIDRSLSSWEQRPVFKTNVKSFVSLRQVPPQIPTAELRQLTEFFPTQGSVFQLDPTFEPERQAADGDLPPPDPLNTARFAVLQRYNRVGLLVPVDAPHMWHASMQSKACRLTVLGEHYRRLVEKDRL
ncbi:MAG: caspase family protein [Deltaproteobacteria bacterium]|nr:caspase family protein [Deltaproteobacteria bacterium]